MNKIAILYSKEEALAMEPAKRPLCYRVPSKIYHETWQADPGSSSPEEHEQAVLNRLFSIADDLERTGLIYENWPAEWKNAASIPNA